MEANDESADDATSATAERKSDEADESARYVTRLAEAFVRGRLGASVDGLEGDALLREGRARGLRLHKFKRNDDLPRVRRVLGLLRGLAPASLLDLGSGRGTFLWPLLEAMPGLEILAVDRDPIRVRDIDAVARGGVTELAARAMDATNLELPDASFDVVTALEILEHLHDPRAAAREALRVAKRFVVASVPSKEDDNPDHHHLFTDATLAALFASDGPSSRAANRVRRITTEHVRGHILAVVHL